VNERRRGPHPGLIALRVVLALVALPAAWSWLPLLDAEPVARLAEYPVAHPEAPGWAQSFAIVHGRFVFDAFATPRETPLAFACLTVIVVLAPLALVLSFTGSRSRSSDSPKA
jgi:hypothetical protein